LETIFAPYSKGLIHEFVNCCPGYNNLTGFLKNHKGLEKSATLLDGVEHFEEKENLINFKETYVSGKINVGDYLCSGSELENLIKYKLY